MPDNTEQTGPPIERLQISDFMGYKDGSPIEVRASQSSRTIGGYAAVFGSSSENLGGFHEQIHPRAFNKSAGDQWPGVVCRFNHSDDYLLGTTSSGTMRLSIDKHGLDYEVDLPECRNDILELTARGDLAHSSFAFQCWSDDWMKDDYGSPVRMLLSCRLIDTAPVVQPAYSSSTVALRSFAQFVDAPYEDVIKRAANHQLDSFLRRTDNVGHAPANKKHDNDVDRLRRNRLDLMAAKGKEIEADIQASVRKDRNRRLEKQLAAAESDQRAAEWNRQLAHQKRLGQLTEAKVNWAS
ncbi:HK97 family phage prohead protease [Mycobacterium colombiense]